MTCSHNGNETIPAMPSEVTIVTNQFVVNGTETNWVDEALSPIEEGRTQFTLTSIPVSGTLIITKNGQALTKTVDYAIVDTVITLTVPCHLGDSYEAHYLAQPA